MKALIALALLLHIAPSAGAQSSCDIRGDYGGFIRFEIYREGGEPPLLFRRVKESRGCHAAFINRSTGFLDYLLANFASASENPALLGVPLADSSAVQRAGAELLGKDSLFGSLMLELTAKSINRSRPKDSVSMDELMDIAVKYFSIIRITEEGSYVGKVCAGLNGIRSTEPVRQPFVEAFCFSSILAHYDDKKYPMQEELILQVRQLYKLRLGLDKRERLLRAQGALYLLMRESKTLRKMLLEEYGQRKEDLPFVLAGR